MPKILAQIVAVFLVSSLISNPALATALLSARSPQRASHQAVFCREALSASAAMFFRSSPANRQTFLRIHRLVSVAFVGGLLAFTAFRWYQTYYFDVPQRIFERGTVLGTIERSWLNDLLAIVGINFPLSYFLMGHKDAVRFGAFFGTFLAVWMEASQWFFPAFNEMAKCYPMTGVTYDVFDQLVAIFGMVFVLIASEFLYYPTLASAAPQGGSHPTPTPGRPDLTGEKFRMLLPKDDTREFGDRSPNAQRRMTGQGDEPPRRGGQEIRPEKSRENAPILMSDALPLLRQMLAAKLAQDPDRQLLMTITGGAGNGKSSFADQLARSDERIKVVHWDKAYDGPVPIVNALNVLRLAQSNRDVRLVIVEGYAADDLQKVQSPWLSDAARGVNTVPDVKIFLSASEDTRLKNLGIRVPLELYWWSSDDQQAEIDRLMISSGETSLRIFPPDLVIDNSIAHRLPRDVAIRILPDSLPNEHRRTTVRGNEWRTTQSFYKDLVAELGLNQGVVLEVGPGLNEAPRAGLLAGGARIVMSLDLPTDAADPRGWIGYRDPERPEGIEVNETSVDAVLFHGSLDYVLQPMSGQSVGSSDRDRSSRARQTFQNSLAVLRPGGRIVVVSQPNMLSHPQFKEMWGHERVGRLLTSIGFDQVHVRESELDGSSRVVVTAQKPTHVSLLHFLSPTRAITYDSGFGSVFELAEVVSDLSQEHLDTLLDLLTAFQIKAFPEIYNADDSPGVKKWFSKILTSLTILVSPEGEIDAYADVHETEEGLLLDQLVTAFDKRSQGIGSFFLLSLIARWKARAIEIVHWFANERSAPLYQRLLDGRVQHERGPELKFIVFPKTASSHPSVATNQFRSKAAAPAVDPGQADKSRDRHWPGMNAPGRGGEFSTILDRLAGTVRNGRHHAMGMARRVLGDSGPIRRMTGQGDEKPKGGRGEGESAGLGDGAKGEGIGEKDSEPTEDPAAASPLSESRSTTGKIINVLGFFGFFLGLNGLGIILLWGHKIISFSDAYGRFDPVLALLKIGVILEGSGWIADLIYSRNPNLNIYRNARMKARKILRELRARSKEDTLLRESLRRVKSFKVASRYLAVVSGGKDRADRTILYRPWMVLFPGLMKYLLVRRSIGLYFDDQWEEDLSMANVILKMMVWRNFSNYELMKRARFYPWMLPYIMIDTVLTSTIAYEIMGPIYPLLWILDRLGGDSSQMSALSRLSRAVLLDHPNTYIARAA